MPVVGRVWIVGSGIQWFEAQAHQGTIQTKKWKIVLLNLKVFQFFKTILKIIVSESPLNPHPTKQFLSWTDWQPCLKVPVEFFHSDFQSENVLLWHLND